jgi:uncharacterized membrane protein
MRKVDPSAVVFAGVSILYPVLAVIAVHTVGPGWVLLGLLAFLGIRAAFGLQRGVPGGLTYALLFVAAAMALAALYDRELSVRLYPAFMSATMLAAFGATLWRGPSMIERFARLVEPNLPESGVQYTRKVTWVWCLFFVVNGAIAVWTALYADWRAWTLYNGLISYLAMGVLFAGEMLVRPFFRRRHDAA